MNPPPLRAWKRTASRYLIRDRWLTLRADRCETSNGVILDPYYVLEPADWVQAVAFDRDDRLLLIRQYRHGAGTIGLELPCGTIEPGETPEEAVRRELLEETGYVARTVQPLPVVSPNPACYANRIHAFVATDIEQTQTQQLDPTEEIEIEVRTITEVLKLIETGEFNQALHVASIFMAFQHRQMLTWNSCEPP